MNTNGKLAELGGKESTHPVIKVVVVGREDPATTMSDPKPMDDLVKNCGMNAVRCETLTSTTIFIQNCDKGRLLIKQTQGLAGFVVVKDTWNGGWEEVDKLLDAKTQAWIDRMTGK